MQLALFRAGAARQLIQPAFVIHLPRDQVALARRVRWHLDVDPIETD